MIYRFIDTSTQLQCLSPASAGYGDTYNRYPRDWVTQSEQFATGCNSPVIGFIRLSRPGTLHACLTFPVLHIAYNSIRSTVNRKRIIRVPAFMQCHILARSRANVEWLTASRLKLRRYVLCKNRSMYSFAAPDFVQRSACRGDAVVSSRQPLLSLVDVAKL